MASFDQSAYESTPTYQERNSTEKKSDEIPEAQVKILPIEIDSTSISLNDNNKKSTSNIDDGLVPEYSNPPDYNEVSIFDFSFQNSITSEEDTIANVRTGMDSLNLISQSQTRALELK